MKIGVIDRDLTAEAKFRDKRSYIAHRKRDGKRVQRLFGDDMSELRNFVFARDGLVCVDGISANCIKGPLLPESGEWRSAELSHLEARSKQGSDDELNTICSCKNCNQKRLHPTNP